MGRQLARARPGCLRWLRAFTHDEHLVEDIMSVAVVWCWEHRDTFTPVIAHEDGMHGVRAWLWGVARHRALAARSSMRSRARTMLSIDEPRTSKDGKQAADTRINGRRPQDRRSAGAIDHISPRDSGSPAPEILGIFERAADRRAPGK